MKTKKLSGVLYDVILAPLMLLFGWSFLMARKKGIHRLPLCRALFNWLGVFPVRHHYYDPFVKQCDLKKPLDDDRNLSGIDWNVDEQLALLREFDFGSELLEFPLQGKSRVDYTYDNGTFLAGDAEYFYSMIRHFKPRRLLEVGCGYTTRLALAAIRRNKQDDATYNCEHTCIEPFEIKLPATGEISYIRELVEDVDVKLFSELCENDILFIDSSHMIRPQGDVLHEIFEILPLLKPGVRVHFHDIFSPKDYPESWILERVRFWNEQYLLEAFLSYNHGFKITGAINFLYHHWRNELNERCPALARMPSKGEPSSFWIQRV
jgi:hypothetical protein